MQTESIALVEVNGQQFWQAEDGFRTPVVAGGSGDFVPDTQGQETGTGEEPSGSESEGQGTSYSLADDFLKDIPETERAIVGKYVKDWDAGVTKKFQEIHSQYEPYKNLGDVEVLQEAMTVRNLLDQSPEVVYSVLKDMFGKDQADQIMDQQQQEQEEEPDEWMQKFSPYQEQIERQGKMLESIAQILLNTQQQAQVNQENQELDSYLGNLRSKYWDFDEGTEKTILSLMAAGLTGDQAVEQIKQIAQQQMQQSQQATAGLPPVLSGGGTPPPDHDVTKLSNKDTKSLVESVVKAAMAGNG